ncbi:cytochrome C oxidase subunit II [Paenibacillaceae bacterium]|nr:cytochrome C oxidase subunit II [Paenibacillaceae bacterium]
MQKWLLFAVFIGASVLGIYLITFGLPDKPVDESASLPEGMQLMKVKASNYEFNQEEYTVKQGDTIRFVLDNSEGIHGMEIVNMNVNLTNDNPTQDVVFDQPGRYEMICSIPCGPGHATMKSVIIVEAPAA